MDGWMDEWMEGQSNFKGFIFDSDVSIIGG